MTATIKPPHRANAVQRRPRFSSLEVLGFSDATSVWSDAPASDAPKPSGRHLALDSEIVADRPPEDFGGHLDGGNVRWWLVLSLIALVVGVAGLGFWLYQRPAIQEQAAFEEVTRHAEALQSGIPLLEQFNADLLVADPTQGTSGLFDVEREARALFQASGDMTSAHGALRPASSRAAQAAIEGTKLAAESHIYRAAILPVLIAPGFETDRDLIELDEAARVFGEWQLSFDEVRTALPDGVLPDVTRQLDILSGDLNSILARYLDALRLDDVSAVEGVLADLNLRLTRADDALATALEDVQRRVNARIEETQIALDQILDR